MDGFGREGETGWEEEREIGLGGGRWGGGHRKEKRWDAMKEKKRISKNIENYSTVS